MAHTLEIVKRHASSGKGVEVRECMISVIGC